MSQILPSFFSREYDTIYSRPLEESKIITFAPFQIKFLQCVQLASVYKAEFDRDGGICSIGGHQCKQLKSLQVLRSLKLAYK